MQPPLQNAPLTAIVRVVSLHDVTLPFMPYPLLSAFSKVVTAPPVGKLVHEGTVNVFDPEVAITTVLELVVSHGTPEMQMTFQLPPPLVVYHGSPLSDSCQRTLVGVEAAIEPPFEMNPAGTAENATHEHKTGVHAPPLLDDPEFALPV